MKKRVNYLGWLIMSMKLSLWNISFLKRIYRYFIQVEKLKI